MELEALVLPLKTDNMSFKAGVAAAAAGVVGLVGAMGVAIKATFDWADDLDKLGDVLGVTNKQAAALAFVARKSGVGVETLAKANVILEKGLVKTDGTLDVTGKKLAEFGINVKGANGNLKDQVALTDEISRKYASFSTQQERINFLTEIYGKNGAQLVDFFDTLAQEGGIDKVQAKVEALGLAIDPNRYEQFNRNLEELKMIGLSLAVAFTENVMPILEKFLGWLGDKAPQAVEAFKKGGLSGLADWIVKEIGNLDTQIAAKLDNVKWDTLGTKFGDWVDRQLENAFQSGNNNLLPKFVVSLTNGLQEAFLHAALGANPEAAWAAFFDNVHREGDSKVRTFFIDWELTWSSAIRTFFSNLVTGAQSATSRFFVNWEVSWTNGLRRIWNDFIAWLDKINRAIAGVPFIGSGWTLPMQTVYQASGGTMGSTGNGGKQRRATGGPVVAGQSYWVGEFKPEVFTPNQSGRIDNAKQQPVVVDIDYGMLARALSTELATYFG